MPFISQVISYIDAALKAGSLNNKKLQPVKFHGLSTIVARKKSNQKDQLELLPGTVSASGIGSVITAESKTPMQIYHKLISTTYSLDKKGLGDSHFMNSTTEAMMVVFTNSKLTGKAKEILEPVVVFGIPQKLSNSLLAELKINNCLITVLSSNMDHVAIFRQEYPQSEYFLNEGVSMFSIRYRITMQFSQSCVDKCLCE
jgi:hypothetical protein